MERGRLLPPLGFPFPVKSRNSITGNAKPETVLSSGRTPYAGSFFSNGNLKSDMLLKVSGKTVNALTPDPDLEGNR
jgi:hypothetical protein